MCNSTVPEPGLNVLLHDELVAPGFARHAAAAVVGDADSDSLPKRYRCLTSWAGAASRETLFDLASLTKPLVALTAASLECNGVVGLDERLDAYLVETRGTPGGQRTLRHHLSHRAGLVAHVEFFRPSWAGRTVHRSHWIRQAASASRVDAQEQTGKGGVEGETVVEDEAAGPGEIAVYSDLGYLLVGAALERVCDWELDELVRRETLAPCGLSLGSARQWLAADGQFARQAAPTEIRPERGGKIHGIVHDDNAWAWGGTGLSGHAGLFGSIQAVADLARACLMALDGHGHWAALLPALIAPRPGGTLLMGFDGVSRPRTSAGSRASVRTFGHLGFTGTSLWVDPDRKRAVALLTNRTFPTREKNPLKLLRPKLHDRLWDWR